jgi:hypothetical protein
MASGKPRLQLGDSWVVEEGESDLEVSPHNEELGQIPTPSFSPPHRSPRNNRSPEPELIMPSLVIESVNGSWVETSGRSVRLRNARPTERPAEPRRRSTRSNMSTGNYEKKLKTVDSSSHRIVQSMQEPRSRTKNHPDILPATLQHIVAIMTWIMDVLTGALKVIKKPLSYILAIWLLFGLFVIARNLITRSVYASLSPMCRIPGASLLNLPFCTIQDSKNAPRPPVEFEQLMTVQAKFEEVLQESAGGVSLPLDMKRGEASIRDLRQLVRYSQLYSK